MNLWEILAGAKQGEHYRALKMNTFSSHIESLVFVPLVEKWTEVSVPAILWPVFFQLGWLVTASVVFRPRILKKKLFPSFSKQTNQLLIAWEQKSEKCFGNNLNIIAGWAKTNLSGIMLSLLVPDWKGYFKLLLL